MELSDIIKILKRNNYLVKFKLTNDGCTIYFPNRIEHPAQYAKNISYKYDGEYLRIYNNQLNVSVKIPDYAYKTYILFHVIAGCILYYYDISLVVFYNINNKQITEDKFILELLPVPTDTSKELNLRSLCIAAYQAGFTNDYEELAKQNNVLEGYLLIKKLMLGEE